MKKLKTELVAIPIVYLPVNVHERRRTVQELLDAGLLTDEAAKLLLREGCARR